MNRVVSRGLRGFTMIELLVVIAIIVMLIGTGTAMFNLFGRGTEVKKSARIVQATFAKVRGMAAKTRKVHFLYFDPVGGEMKVFRDENRNKQYDAGTDVSADKEGPARILKGTLFKVAPTFIGFRPDGSLILPPGSPSSIEVVRDQMENLRMILDFSQSSGLITRTTFLAQ